MLAEYMPSVWKAHWTWHLVAETSQQGHLEIDN